jgi:large-conductance mechanosensitive channel
MIASLKAFTRFWYQFFVGDDWTMAVGVVIALALTAVVNRLTPHAWWITPVAVIILMVASVYRAASRILQSDSEDH